MFDNTGYLFTYSAEQGKVHAIRLNHLGFKYRQVFYHFSVLPFPAFSPGGFLFCLFHRFITLFFSLSLQAGKFIRKDYQVTSFHGIAV